jgi:uncharacterized protein (DUF58 family)
MNIRRKILLPQLLNYIKIEFKYYNLNNNLAYNSHIYNNFSFFCVLVVLSFVFGFFKPIFWVIGLSSLVLVVFLYLKTLKLCQGITVQRKIPKLARERKVIEIIYWITNETAFPMINLSFTEKFDGVQAGYFNVCPGRNIPPHTKIQYSKKVLLDAGMGVKAFAPINVILKDDLGIFEFEVNFKATDEIEVYPFIDDIPPLKASVSPDTTEYGFYDIAKRGDSNLFIGTREYRYGDPVKHINWRLTKKTNKVIVNEYEKNTNTFVTLILDLDLGSQLGFGELSTWEAAKDLALSISTNEIRKNNLIQIVSNNLYIPFGSGKNQMMIMEKHFTFHEMVNFSELNYLRHLNNLPEKGQIYYICPLVMTPKSVEILELLRKLKMDGQSVVIFVLDPYETLVQSIKGDMKIGIREMDRHAREEFKNLEIKFQKIGLPIINLKVKKEKLLYEQIVINAQNLIEVK